jgi:cytochrome c oxidase assembly protein subunit 15
VDVESGRLARLRAGEVAPERFRAWAFGGLGAILLVVTTGATVRLTGSGLGCDNWPRCGDTPFPEKDGHAVIEFSNRVVALGAILVTLAVWLMAGRVRGLPRWAQRLAFVLFLGNVAQIPLGGLTVILDLHPLLVVSHFLLAMSVLAGAVVLALESHRLVVGGAASTLPRWLRLAGAGLAVCCFALVVTGALATASGPHAGGDDIRRLGEPLRSIRIHAGATLGFGLCFAVVLGFLIKHRDRWPRLLDAALGLALLLALQVAIGETQYHNGLPWLLVLAHVSVAATVWAATVCLAVLLARPSASFAAPARVD